jgi:hypothetical protein
MVGDEDGNFNPDKQVTRAEMATVMANLLDLNVDSYKNAALSFTDVPEWAVPYVAACAANGIVSGYSDTTFGSDDAVTAAQAGLMVMKALGYFQYANDFGSDWQLATARQANKLDLYDDISAGIRTSLTRNDVAQLVLNALETPTVEAVGGLTVSGNGIVVNADTEYNEITKSGDKYTVIGSDHRVELGEDLFDGKLSKDDSATDDLGRPATTWEYKGDKIGTYAESVDYTVILDDEYTAGSDTVLSILEDVLNKKDMDYNESSYVDDQNVTHTYTSANVYVQGTRYRISDADSKTAANNAFKSIAQRGTVVEVYVDSKNTKVVKTVVAYNYSLDQIDSVSTSLTSSDIKDGATYSVTFKNIGTFNDTKIPGFNAKTYVEDAYVAVAYDNVNDVVLASAIADEVEGTVSAKKEDTTNNILTLTVSGTKYYTAPGYGTYDYSKNYSAIDTDESYLLYLDPNGYVVGIDGVSGTQSIKDVYYVDSVWSESNTVTGGTSSTTWYAQLVSVVDGTVSEIKLEAVSKNSYIEGSKTDKEVSLGQIADGEAADSTVTVGDKWEGQLVTISDKKWVSEADKTYKANNGKYDLELYTSTSQEDFDVYNDVNADGSKFEVTLKKSDTRATLGTGSYRLNSSTKYLFLEDVGNDLSVKTYTGGVSYSRLATDTDGVNRIIVITEDKSTVAKYVLIMTGDADQGAEYSAEMLYIRAGDKASIGTDTYTQTVWFNDGTSAEVTIDDAIGNTNGQINPGFYTYELNNGIYKLTEADLIKIDEKDEGGNWDDEEGVLQNAILNSADNVTDNNTYITVTADNTAGDNKTYKSIDVSKAKVVDIRDESDRKIEKGQYGSKISSVSGLVTALKYKYNDNGTLLTVPAIELQLNISEDGAVIIFVTDAALQ